MIMSQTKAMTDKQRNQLIDDLILHLYKNQDILSCSTVDIFNAWDKHEKLGISHEDYRIIMDVIKVVKSDPLLIQKYLFLT